MLSTKNGKIENIVLYSYETCFSYLFTVKLARIQDSLFTSGTLFLNLVLSFYIWCSFFTSGALFLHLVLSFSIFLFYIIKCYLFPYWNSILRLASDPTVLQLRFFSSRSYFYFVKIGMVYPPDPDLDYKYRTWTGKSYLVLNSLPWISFDLLQKLGPYYYIRYVCSRHFRYGTQAQYLLLVNVSVTVFYQSKLWMWKDPPSIHRETVHSYSYWSSRTTRVTQ